MVTAFRDSETQVTSAALDGGERRHPMLTRQNRNGNIEASSPKFCLGGVSGIASPSPLCTAIKPASPSTASTSIVLHSFCHAVSWPPRPFWGLSSANPPTRTACCVQSSPSNHHHDGLDPLSILPRP